MWKFLMKQCSWVLNEIGEGEFILLIEKKIPEVPDSGE